MTTQIVRHILSVRWADVDANQHMRHSAYSDFAADARVAMFAQLGYPLTRLAEVGAGPVLFHEEIEYRREAHLLQTLTVDCQLAGLSQRGERWAFRCHLHREDEELAAIVTVRGAWIDMRSRSLCVPPVALVEALRSLERAPDFEEIAVRTPPSIDLSERE